MGGRRARTRVELAEALNQPLPCRQVRYRDVLLNPPWMVAAWLVRAAVPGRLLPGRTGRDLASGIAQA
jgi:hypothetical protein